MTVYTVAAPLPLLPDPDESSSPVLTLEPRDVITIEKTLKPWCKVSLTRAGAAAAGWVISDMLIPIVETTVRLFDEPLGSLVKSVTGHVEVIAQVASWAKVKVTQRDGSPPSVGWTEDATSAPVPAKPDAPPASPGKPAEPPAGEASDGGVDLVLGPNERYRAALLMAEARTKIDAAALAALIDAEAARIRNGPEAGTWDPQSSAEGSSAKGLTQFLDDTWRTMACTPGTLLNDVATQKKCLTADNTVAAGMDDTLLDLRFDPTISIVTAAEYGLANLRALQAARLIEPDLGDDERARFIYLAHHEGPSGAKSFLRGDANVPLSKLAAQVGDERARQLTAAAGGDVALAYRTWLTAFMDQKIQPSRFRLQKPPAGLDEPRKRSALTNFSGQPIPVADLQARTDLVIELQQALSDLGYLDPPPDGFMGPTTRWALAEFCSLNELSLDRGFTKAIATALVKPKRVLPAIHPGQGWIDRVLAFMVKQNHFICRHPDCKNIIYVEGLDPNGKLNPQTPNAFHDLRIVVSIGADGKPVVQSWVATTRPGRFYTMNPKNPKGAAQIALGQYKAWHVGIHAGATGADAHEALIQAAPITIYRDTNKDFKRDGPTSTGLFGINQHWGFDLPRNDAGKASAGCLVGEMRDEHRAFMALVKSDPRYVANNGYKFVTAILSGPEVFGTDPP